MSFSSKFTQPLLIYDDKCISCENFAKTVAKISKGWIRIAGHYHSQEAIDTKKMIFPINYDPTEMFWLINKKGAFGARAGLFQVIKEIIIGNFKNKLKSHYMEDLNNNNLVVKCNYQDKESCMSTKNTINRIFNMIKNSKKVKFKE
jgi:hypothetical protein